MDSFAEPHRRTEHSLDDVRAQLARLEAEHRAKGITLTGRIIHVCHYLPVSFALAPSPVPSSSSPADADDADSPNGIPSPPQTPPSKAIQDDTPPSPIVGGEDAALPAHTQAQELEEPSGVNSIQDTQDRFVPVPPSAFTDGKRSRWQLATRHGHSALVSGIASLTSTHEQLFVGWTGDVYAGPVRAADQEDRPKLRSGDIGTAERRELEEILGDIELAPPKDKEQERKKLKYVPVWLDDKIAHGHYDGYCKQSEFSGLLSISYFPLFPMFLHRLRTFSRCAP